MVRKSAPGCSSKRGHSHGGASHKQKVGFPSPYLKAQVSRQQRTGVGRVGEGGLET